MYRASSLYKGISQSLEDRGQSFSFSFLLCLLSGYCVSCVPCHTRDVSCAQLLPFCLMFYRSPCQLQTPDWHRLSQRNDVKFTFFFNNTKRKQSRSIKIISCYWRAYTCEEWSYQLWNSVTIHVKNDHINYGIAILRCLYRLYQIDQTHRLQNSDTVALFAVVPVGLVRRSKQKTYTARRSQYRCSPSCLVDCWLVVKTHLSRY